MRESLSKAIPRTVALYTILAASIGPALGQPGSPEGLWACTLPDGSLVFSDRELSGDCRPLSDLPGLQRLPPELDREPPDPPAEEPGGGPSPRPIPGPIPGGARRIDPPADTAITISHITAVPNFNSALGIAHYQATMSLENVDSTWTAAKVCVDVRFHDVNRLFVDVHQIGCLEDLQPFVPKTLTVTYTGIVPPRLVPIEAEAEVDYVKWTK